jgi:hypothetical protein
MIPIDAHDWNSWDKGGILPYYTVCIIPNGIIQENSTVKSTEVLNKSTVPTEYQFKPYNETLFCQVVVRHYFEWSIIVVFVH